MCRGSKTNRYKRAFFSLDAALALAIAVAAFAALAQLSLSSASALRAQSEELSSSLLALRLSSYVADEAGAEVGGLGGAYTAVGELELERLRSIDLQQILSQTNRRFASIRLKGNEGELFSSFAGEAGDQTFCAARLALHSGEIVRLEVCVS
jgi:hypothetical protein